MIGVDIEDISRFANKDRIADKKFLERIFTPSEIDYCYLKSNPAPHLCARFCAKEAVIKALGSIGINHSKYNDIEVYHNELGAPLVRICDNDDIKIEISLSHDKTKAVAIAQIQRTEIEN